MDKYCRSSLNNKQLTYADGCIENYDALSSAFYAF